MAEMYFDPVRDEGGCGRVLIGQGDDTFDPVCQLPARHSGPCSPALPDPDPPRMANEVEAVAVHLFVAVARAPWTRREDDERCDVKPITKNECRNIARGAIAALDATRGKPHG